MNITQGLRRALQVNPSGLAAVDDNCRRTWREFGERVARLAAALRGLGVAAGDRVAILMMNSDRYLELYLAVPWSGGVIVPVNIRWSPIEIEDALGDCSAKVLVVDRDFEALGAALADKLSMVLVHAHDEAAPAGAQSYERLLLDATAIPDAMRRADELAAIFYTGGTTGRSKGVMLSHDNIVANSMHLMAEGLLPHGTVYLNAAPMFHVANSGVMFASLIAGATNVVIRGFEPLAAMRAIAQENVTSTLIVPTMIQMLLDHPEFHSDHLSSMQMLMYGASPISPTLLGRAIAALPHVAFHQLYGMTELAPMATHLPWDQHVGPGSRLRSCGRAAIGCEIEIVDGNREPVPRHVIGEVAVRGRNMMMGYWERPEETQKAIVGGWMHTGDGGYMDEDGYVFLVDRLKDMIISGGENVYSTEVENVILEYQAVAQCAVIGIPDPQWGEAVNAVVISKPGMKILPEDIIAFCKTKIASYKCPRAVHVRTDPFPLSGAGKVLKRELRRAYSAVTEQTFGDGLAPASITS